MNASFEPKEQERSRYSHRNECQSAISSPSRTIVHAKLEMTEPGDHDEQEADAVANAIVGGGKLARKISSGASGSSGIAVSHQMESQLSQLQGGGRQMPEGLRNMMESGFGQDFSHVRLHTDSKAASMSSSIHAKAFTLGNDIYFNQGQFSPNTTEGQRLVAHELTHVAQGGNSVKRSPSDTDVSGSQDNGFEGLFLQKSNRYSNYSVYTPGIVFDSSYNTKAQGAGKVVETTDFDSIKKPDYLNTVDTLIDHLIKTASEEVNYNEKEIIVKDEDKKNEIRENLGLKSNDISIDDLINLRKKYDNLNSILTQFEGQGIITDEKTKNEIREKLNLTTDNISVSTIQKKIKTIKDDDKKQELKSILNEQKAKKISKISDEGTKNKIREILNQTTNSISVLEIKKMQDELGINEDQYKYLNEVIAKYKEEKIIDEPNTKNEIRKKLNLSSNNLYVSELAIMLPQLKKQSQNAEDQRKYIAELIASNQEKGNDNITDEKTKKEIREKLDLPTDNITVSDLETAVDGIKDKNVKAFIKKTIDRTNGKSEITDEKTKKEIREKLKLVTDDISLEELQKMQKQWQDIRDEYDAKYNYLNNLLFSKDSNNPGILYDEAILNYLNGGDSIKEQVIDLNGELHSIPHRIFEGYWGKGGEHNITKYHHDLGQDSLQGQAWCDWFVHWCFVKAFNPVDFKDKDKLDNNFSAIKKGILLNTMYETGQTTGSVSGSIHFFEEMDEKMLPENKKLFFRGFTKDKTEKVETDDDFNKRIEEKLSSKWDRDKYKQHFQNMKKNGVQQPQKGDVVFFIGHIGLVKSVSNDSITTIEGNTTKTGFSSNGGGVFEKTYSNNPNDSDALKAYQKIIGYGHPDYENLRKYLNEVYDTKSYINESYINKKKKKKK